MSAKENKAISRRIRKEITMSVEENSQLDEELIAAMNAHDVERVTALLSDDAVVINPSLSAPIRGNAAYGQHWQGIFESFPDYSIVVKNRIATEDQVATEVEFSGTHKGPLSLGPGDPIPPTGKKFAINGAYFARIRNGKIVEMHQYPDLAGFLMQLGLIPAPEPAGT